ncbi:hypothetical protein COBT_000727 [Conglomerata obtusa]
MCSNISTNELLVCTDIPTYGQRLSIVKLDDCNFIVNENKLCLTRGKLIEDPIRSELEQLNILSGGRGGTSFHETYFEGCTKSDDQCFDFHEINSESVNSKRTRVIDKINQNKMGDESKKLSNNEFSNVTENKPERKYEEAKDYDLKYVNEKLDDAHHFLAEEDPDAIILRKHYAPECFFGYNSVGLFFNDPLPNLRKLKQRYCFYNKKDIMRN